MPYIQLLQFMDCQILLSVIMDHRLQEFKNFIHKNAIKHIITAPYHLLSNGAAERAV